MSTSSCGTLCTLSSYCSTVFSAYLSSPRPHPYSSPLPGCLLSADQQTQVFSIPKGSFLNEPSHPTECLPSLSHFLSSHFLLHSLKSRVYSTPALKLLSPFCVPVSNSKSNCPSSTPMHWCYLRAPGASDINKSSMTIFMDYLSFFRQLLFLP